MELTVSLFVLFGIALTQLGGLAVGRGVGVGVA